VKSNLQALAENNPAVEEAVVSEIYRENPNGTVQVAVHGFANFLKYFEVLTNLGYKGNYEENDKYPQSFGGYFVATLDIPSVNISEEIQVDSEGKVIQDISEEKVKGKPGRKPKGE
jgi:hypothetical protein